MTWQNVILKVFNRASPEYRAAINFENFEKQLEAAGILSNPLRIAHFFATVGVESGHMTALRENLSYSASQISKVFGVGKHSAAITPAEAAKLARKPEALAERVYGLGNPRKARELGNTVSGDGYRYRGIGPFQNTGKKNIMDMIIRLGVRTEMDLLAAANLFQPAILFWKDNSLNLLADKDDARSLRKRVNGGYNGYEEYVALKDRILKMLTGEVSASIQQTDHEVLQLQADLKELGYPLEIDGKYGPKTTAAVKEFQRTNGLKVDGVAGEATKAVIRQRLETTTPNEPTRDERDTDRTATNVGAGSVGLAAAGEFLLSTARELGNFELDSPIFRAIPAILLLVGAAMMIWPMIRRR